MKTKVFLFLMLSTIVCWGQIPTDDVMRYRFINNSLVNEASPGVGDLVQSGSTATFTNGVERTQNSGLDVNTDSFVGGKTGSGALLSSFSFSFWIKLDNTEDSRERIICSIDAPGSVNYEFLTQVVNENDPDVFFTWRTFGNGATGRQSILPLNDGEWHHIVFVRRQFSASGAMFSGYLDGVLSTLIAISSDNVGAAFNRLDNPALTISPSNEYTREIDNIRFYERALTQTEVTALYEEGDVVSFSDANFKNLLVNNASVNTNGDTEIQVSEATTFAGEILIQGIGVSDLTGLEEFTSLTSLVIFEENISTIDVSSLVNLEELDLEEINISTLDLSKNIALTELRLIDLPNLLTIDLSQNSLLEVVNFDTLEMTSLDFSNNSLLSSLSLVRFPSLQSVDLRNGNNTAISSRQAFIFNPNLTCINVDDVDFASTFWNNRDSTLSYSTDCSVPQRTLTLNSNGVGGFVTTDLIAINREYDEGTIVELTATPVTGYQFDGWSGDASGTDNPLSITMDADKTITPIFSLDATANVVDAAFNNAINVYPNPVTNSLQITLATGEELKKVEVFNLIGKKVLESTNNTIDFSSLSTGVYILKIENNTGKIATKKVVKK